MKRLLMGMVIAAVGGLLAASCRGGSGGSVGNSSGVPRSSTIGSLDSSQAVTLCDWENAKQGGYGRSITCPDGSTQTTDADRATCVSQVPYFGTYCPTLTVGDIEDCANALGINICNVGSEPACGPVAACLGY
jgi:hypothetical protein